MTVDIMMVRLVRHQHSGTVTTEFTCVHSKWAQGHNRKELSFFVYGF